MSIRGNIAEAALADVVQLLALGRRTGRLTAARDGELGTLWFVDGAVAHATLAHRRDALGALLVRRGLLDDADLRAALVEQAAEPDTPLGVLLVRRGCVPRGALLARLEEQTAEAAYELLGWTRGTFSFDSDVASLPSELTPRLDVGSLLLEAARRADDEVLIATEVPGRTSTFAPVAAAGAPNAARDEVAERVIALLDGARDVRAVADAAGLAPYHVSRALFALVREGRVRRVPSRAAVDVPAHLAVARADEHLNLGIAFARAGLLDDALRELRRVLEFLPGDVGARGHLGAVALRAGRLDEAVAVLGEAATMPGVSGAALHALGLARHRLGQLELAHEAYAHAARLGLEHDPRHLTARAALALDRREWEVARELLERARAHWTAPPAVWYHYALLAALYVRDARGAATLAREGRAAHPRAAALLANRAAHRAQTRRPEHLAGALADVMGALAERSDLAPAQRLLGELQYRAGRFDRAREAYEAATRLAPDASADAWARLGTLALRAGDGERARRAWERACSLQPEHPTARANLDALRRSGAAAPAAL
ncbi:hypothetical protein tb265_28710 [Gemmatimonadetes bacterium T265]|nr:hypothetical protein tb265_28710 [Gemmatimonadetes bacterium T265]